MGEMGSRDVQGDDREIVTADAGGGMEAAERCGNGRGRCGQDVGLGTERGAWPLLRKRGRERRDSATLTEAV